QQIGKDTRGSYLGPGTRPSDNQRLRVVAPGLKTYYVVAPLQIRERMIASVLAQPCPQPAICFDHANITQHPFARSSGTLQFTHAVIMSIKFVHELFRAGIAQLLRDEAFDLNLIQLNRESHLACEND